MTHAPKNHPHSAPAQRLVRPAGRRGLAAPTLRPGPRRSGTHRPAEASGEPARLRAPALRATLSRTRTAAGGTHSGAGRGVHRFAARHSQGRAAAVRGASADPAAAYGCAALDLRVPQLRRTGRTDPMVPVRMGPRAPPSGRPGIGCGGAVPRGETGDPDQHAGRAARGNVSRGREQPAQRNVTISRQCVADELGRTPGAIARRY